MKKKLIFPLIAALLVSGFAGCGGGGASSTASSDAPAATETPAASTTAETPAETPAEGEASGDDLAFRKFDEPVDVHIGMSVSPIDTTLPAGDSAEDNQYTRYLRDNYNINVIVDWTAAEGNDYNQKVSLAIASDSLPDGLVANDRTYMVSAAKSDMLYDITDLFQKYASTQVKGIMDSTEGRAYDHAGYNGRMVALPHVSVTSDGVHNLNVRKDWLDQYGLEIPKTVDDIENIARTFMKEKPAGDNTIGITGPSKSGLLYSNFLNSSDITHSYDPVFQAYDVYPGYWLDNGDGTVSYGSIDDNMKPALERLASWYAEGLIDPEMGTRDNSTEAVNAGYAGMWCGPWWSLGYGNGDAFVNDPTANWQAYPIFADDGKWNVHMKTIGKTFCMISKKSAEDTAAAIIIMYNALVRDEATFDTSVAIGWYPLRVVAAAADEVDYTAAELVKVLNGETEPEAYNDPLSIYKLLYQDVSKVRNVVPGYESGRELSVSDFNMENRGDFQRMYAQLIGSRPYATTAVDKTVYSVTYSLTETMEKRWSNLKKMEDEVMLKIITGQSDISAFDEFKANWLSQGGQEILDEVKALL